MIRLELEGLLKERGRSYYWLGKNANINPQVITRMKHLRIKAITLDVLDRICDLLECEPGDVLKRGPGPKPKGAGKVKKRG